MLISLHVGTAIGNLGHSMPEIICTDSGRRMVPVRSLLGACRSLVAQELYEQRAHLFRLLLLHPMPGSVQSMEAHHSCARAVPHLVQGARGLMDAPVAP